MARADMHVRHVQQAWHPPSTSVPTLDTLQRGARSSTARRLTLWQRQAPGYRATARAGFRMGLMGYGRVEWGAGRWSGAATRWTSTSGSVANTWSANDG